MSVVALLLLLCLTIVLLLRDQARTQTRHARPQEPALELDLNTRQGLAPPLRTSDLIPCGVRIAAKDTLLRTEERRFLHVLEQAIGPDYRIFTMVRVADVLNVITDNRSHWQRLFNQLSCKHFDFVVCRPGDLKVLYAVELNGTSHNRYDRRERDLFLSEVCADAGLPLYWFPVQARYSVDKVRAELMQLPLAS